MPPVIPPPLLPHRDASARRALAENAKQEIRQSKRIAWMPLIATRIVPPCFCPNWCLSPLTVLLSWTPVMMVYPDDSATFQAHTGPRAQLLCHYCDAPLLAWVSLLHHPHCLPPPLRVTVSPIAASSSISRWTRRATN